MIDFSLISVYNSTGIFSKIVDTKYLQSHNWKIILTKSCKDYQCIDCNVVMRQDLYSSNNKNEYYLFMYKENMDDKFIDVLYCNEIIVKDVLK